jgi:hypothetical protein
MTDYTTYMVAAGWDNTDDLQDLDPQPHCPGIKDGIRRFAGDGLVYPDGYGHASLFFGYNPNDKQDWSSVLSQVGLSASTPSVYLTITLRQNLTNTFVPHNVVITMPDVPDDGKYENTAWQELEFKLTSVHEVSA